MKEHACILPMRYSFPYVITLPSPTLYHACTNGPATRRQGGGGPYIPVLSEVETGLSPRK